MSYQSKTWVDMRAEYPTRYKIRHSDLTEEQVTIANDFGTVVEGDVFDESTMNNLESRIASAFSDDADAIEDASGLNFAEEYDPTSTYAVGDFCVHDGILYKCSTAISSAEPWTVAHWQRTYATDEIAGASSLQGLSDVNISSPTDGQALVYDSASSKWVNGAGGGGSSASGVYIGTCDTEASTSAKQVTVSSDQNFSLKKGVMVQVSFSIANTARNVTISVNGSTAYPIWYGTTEYTGVSTTVTGTLGYKIAYVFNGTHWVWQAFSYYPSYSRMTQAEAEAGTSTSDRVIQPTILKQAIQYHAPSAVRTELTQAQYDALTEAEKNNGTIYFITDAPSNPVDYSTSEKVIGHWVDGSTLYEQTFYFDFSDIAGGTQSQSVINGRFDLPHIDYADMWIEQGFIINDIPDSSLTIKSMPLPISASSGAYTRIQIQKTSSNDGYPFIYIDINYNTSAIYDKRDDIHFVFVVRYTKSV